MWYFAFRDFGCVQNTASRCRLLQTKCTIGCLCTPVTYRWLRYWMYASETFFSAIRYSCRLRCRRSTQQWLVSCSCEVFLCLTHCWYLGLKCTTLFASAQQVKKTCGILVSVSFCFVSINLVSWSSSLAGRTRIEMFATILQYLSWELNVFRYVALVRGLLSSQALLWTMYLFYRMGIFHIARAIHPWRDIHECIVLPHVFRGLIVSVHSVWCNVGQKRFGIISLRTSCLALPFYFF